jgi:lipoprotein-releasing system ATP-binding protein
MSDAILAARKVSKVYRTGAKEVRAVDGVDLAIGRGSTTVILGPSGAGKSTLLHLMGALDNPTSGSVLIDGADVYRYTDRERSRIRNSRIGFIFQFYHLLPEFTALENVMMPAMIRSGKAARNRAADLLDSVGLKDRMAHRPAELSGGEQQRVAIARALMNEPAALLCDEPTGNLDSQTSGSIYEMLFGLNSSSGTALVIVTHDESISRRTDHVVRLRDGKVV